MGKHNVLEIFGKKHSSAGAVLKGTAGHRMWARGKSLWKYSFASGFEGTPAITSHHDVTMKAPVWRKNSFLTSCWNISSLDCRFGWERLSFSAGALSARQATCYQSSNALCGWGSILCLKYLFCQGNARSWRAYYEQEVVPFFARSEIQEGSKKRRLSAISSPHLLLALRSNSHS